MATRGYARTSVSEWAGLNTLLFPRYRRCSNGTLRRNVTVAHGAVNKEGKLRPKEHRNGFASRSETRLYGDAHFDSPILTRPYMTAIAVSTRPGIEIIDIDGCASQTYYAIHETLTENEIPIIATVESGSTNSLHMYCALPLHVDPDDFRSWVTEATEHLIPFDPNAKKNPRVEYATDSSIRVPGSCSLKRKSWARPVHTSNPFRRERYLGPCEVLKQAHEALDKAGIDSTGDVADPTHRAAQRLTDALQSSISHELSTGFWATLNPDKVHERQDNAHHKAIQHSTSRCSHRDSSHIDPETALSELDSQTSGDRSYSALMALHVGWTCGYRSEEALHEFIATYRKDHTCLAKAHGSWARRAVHRFMVSRIEYLSSNFHADNPDEVRDVEAYRAHLLRQRQWERIALAEQWDWWITWALAVIHHYRFADSWTGENIPLSFRDIRLWTGYGTSRVGALLRELVDRGVIVRTEKGDAETAGSRQASTWTLLAPSRQRLDTIDETDRRYIELEFGGVRLPLWHHGWHPALMTAEGYVAEGHPLMFDGEPDHAPLWRNLLSQMGTTMERVGWERQQWARSRSEQPSTDMRLLSYGVGSPRAILSGADGIHDPSRNEEGVTQCLPVQYSCEQPVGLRVCASQHVSRGP